MPIGFSIFVYSQVQTIEPKVGKKTLKKLKKAERDKTKGKDWFDMKAPEVTPELQNELDVLKMRGAVDPTRFYKRADMAAPPKYFQVLAAFGWGPIRYYSAEGALKNSKSILNAYSANNGSPMLALRLPYRPLCHGQSV